MKKILTVSLFFLLVLVMASFVLAAPVKDFYGGKTAGRSGFTNIVDSNMDSDPSGWVKYSKVGKALHTTWVMSGLKPSTEYQLKLHSTGGNSFIANACGTPNQYVPCGSIQCWMCGIWKKPWGNESFLVMAIVKSNKKGYINTGVKEDRLEGGKSGHYVKMQFMVTENSSPWLSAWTWEHPSLISEFNIK